jgi:hypothetical protein
MHRMCRIEMWIAGDPSNTSSGPQGSEAFPQAIAII